MSSAAIGVLLVLSLAAVARGEAIHVLDVPAYGVAGSIRGSVEAGNGESRRIAIYLYVDGVGWWNKAPVEAAGSFTADVATGGIDELATIYCVAVFPLEGAAPPQASGAHALPDLSGHATDCYDRFEHPPGYDGVPVVHFAGHDWAVKRSQGPRMLGQVGPGANVFSDAAQDVFVDAEGLHLTIHHHDGYWWASEVILVDRSGYGTYAFQTSSRLDVLDANAVFGAFTWDPYGDETRIADPKYRHREIDFEDSRWGNRATNAQMVVQPFDVAGNEERYDLPDLSADARLTRIFRWLPDRIDFFALRGSQPAQGFEPQAVIHEFHYLDESPGDSVVPHSGRQHFHFNLWLDSWEIAPDPKPELPPQPPGAPVEIVITDFVPEPARMAVGVAALAALLSLRAQRSGRA